MSYIGKTPTVGNFIKLDDITTSSTNSYTLQHNSVNFSPESANHMLVSLNGVIQAPNTSYSVSGSTITFLPSSGTLSSSDSIDFIMVYGNVLDVGVASTVSDASITKAKMNLISDSSSAGLTIKGDGGSENGTIALNCSSNSHAVKISSPSHASGQSYEMILPTTNITAGKFLKVDSVSGSGATGVGQLSFADAGGGIEEVDRWVMSSQTYSNNDYLTAGWSRHLTLTGAPHGTGLSESSGVFSFPSTGVYKMDFQTYFWNNAGTRGYLGVDVRGTNDNFSSNDQRISLGYTHTSVAQDHSGLFMSWLIDVTNTSNNKFKLLYNGSNTGGFYFTYLNSVKLMET